MHLTTQEIPVQNLEIGMYVSRLDVPWVQTPFPIQGFYITRQEELELLAHYCNKVYVDSFLSKVDVRSKLTLAPTGGKKPVHADPKINRLMTEKARFKPRVENYVIESKLKKEVKIAAQTYDRVSSQMATVIRSLGNGGLVNLAEVRKSANEMVKSVIRNPNALAWLCRMNRDHKALHQQAVRAAVWGLIFARHLGLSRHDLRDIGTALLLSPIGKTKLDPELLSDDLSGSDIKKYQQHVELTLAETEKMFSASHQVNYILAAYCERNDGSGYPRQLIGNRIPFLARVAGIADYYEQLINPLNTERAVSPAEAISHLYNVRGRLFQKELVEEFIQAIGIYPTGSLVELNNKSVAVVLEQPEKSRLKPKVAIIKDALRGKLNKPKIVELSNMPTDDFGVPLTIAKSLKSTSLEINSDELYQQLFANSSFLAFFRK